MGAEEDPEGEGDDAEAGGARERARAELEAELARRFAAGDLDGVMAMAVEGYGAELFGFLVGLTRDPIAADDVFSATCERIWRGLPKFRWDSTLRVWAYAIARNEFLRSTRTTARQKREVPVSQIASIQQAIDRVRSTTPVHERTAVKDRFAKLREQLAPEDHMLLGLRIDRKMAWNDIVRVLAEADGEAAAVDVTREAAALRKRFERLKTKLRELARQATSEE
ncbi:MAG: sigma-70 family RNA polymerase sigma factor [Deltaproteobacteria bacterium]|nr:sigma-70 family RNA polymerase sigma factor [Deltaproteobacteria bacterium]MCW5803410.1 sigma-70 family RNA polymerase sigma factor [Deltaproteobacteria bacterium]